MTAEIRPFGPLYLQRITQLVNKTNQFNLTTRRYTQSEIEACAADPARVCLYGKLADKFGDNGLVSVLIGRLDGGVMTVELFLMSCRVLKRGMERAMLNALAADALRLGARALRGVYLPTQKNGMVKELYGELGFTRAGDAPDGGTVWERELASFSPLPCPIAVNPRNAEKETSK